MADAKDLIEGARLPEARVPLCLRGDLLAELAELEVRLAEARKHDHGNSLASGGAAREVAEEIERVHREIAGSTHPFLFRALPRREFRDLQENHPPRKGHQVDEAMGFNVDSIQGPLITACCVDPEMTEEETADLLDVLSDGQATDLFSCALGLNKGRVNLPKFETASAVLARPEPRSRPPAPGVSPGNGSSAGSLAG